MKTRLEHFRDLRNHAWYGSRIAKLKQPSIDLIEQFIQQHDHLGIGEFEMANNRWWVDRQDRPKNWSMLQELVMISNTILSQNIPK
jgi:hypothetical protein